MDNTKMIVKEPLYGRMVETRLSKMSECIYGLNWTLKAKGYLSLKDYRAILANMLGLNIPDQYDEDEIGFWQFGDDETETFYHSKIDATYDHENNEFVTFTEIKYRKAPNSKQ